MVDSSGKTMWPLNSDILVTMATITNQVTIFLDTSGLEHQHYVSSSMSKVTVCLSLPSFK